MIIWSTLFTWLKVWKTAIVMYRITRQPYWIKPRGLITSHDAYRTFVIAYMTAIFAILSKDTEEVIIWPHYFTTLGETQRRWFFAQIYYPGQNCWKMGFGHLLHREKMWEITTLWIRKICFSPNNRAVSVSKIQSYFWV